MRLLGKTNKRDNHEKSKLNVNWCEKFIILFVFIHFHTFSSSCVFVCADCQTTTAALAAAAQDKYSPATDPG